MSWCPLLKNVANQRPTLKLRSTPGKNQGMTEIQMLAFQGRTSMLKVPKDVHVPSQGQDSDVNDEMRNQVIISPAKRETKIFY